MAKFIGSRRISVWEYFEIEADNEQEALNKLANNQMLGEPYQKSWGEEYTDFEVKPDDSLG